MRAGIYRIVNNIAHKLYLGSSSDLLRRIESHLQRLRKGNHSNRYLQHAWDRDGEENFEFQCVTECHEANLLQQEQWWLDYYAVSYGWDNLYNLAPSAGAPMKGRRHSAAARARISQARKVGRSNMKGRKHSEATRELMRVSRIGKPHPHRGHAITQETKDKIGRSENRARLLGEANPFFGKTHSDETRQRISATRRGVPWTAARRAAQKVVVNG
jgi:group I intron endonuclease